MLKVINSIPIEVLGAVAEQECKKTTQRQAEGIAAMPVVNGNLVSVKTAKRFSKPCSEINDGQFKKLVQKNTVLSPWQAAAESLVSAALHDIIE